MNDAADEPFWQFSTIDRYSPPGRLVAGPGGFIFFSPGRKFQENSDLEIRLHFP
jgi:hypothetical protein